MQCSRIFAVSAAENARQSPNKRFCFRYPIINFPNKTTSSGLCILFNSSNRLYRVQCSRIFCCLRSRKCEVKPEQTAKRSYELEYECISPFLPGISNMCFCLTACELDINLRRSFVGITWNLSHSLNLRGSKIFSFKTIYVE